MAAIAGTAAVAAGSVFVAKSLRGKLEGKLMGDLTKSFDNFDYFSGLNTYADVRYKNGQRARLFFG